MGRSNLHQMQWLPQGMAKLKQNGMKHLLICFLVLCVGITNHAYGENHELFKNDKVGIFHWIKSGDLVPSGHFLIFDNYTNNNLRVTYKVTVRVVVKASRTYQDITYTATAYIKPRDRYLDSMWGQQDVWTFIENHSADMYFEKNFHLMLRDFELINYGIEKKNYETAY